MVFKETRLRLYRNNVKIWFAVSCLAVVLGLLIFRTASSVPNSSLARRPLLPAWIPTIFTASLQSSMEVTSCWTHCSHTDGTSYQRWDSSRTHTRAHTCTHRHVHTHRAGAQTHPEAASSMLQSSRGDINPAALRVSLCVRQSRLRRSDPQTRTFVCLCVLVSQPSAAILRCRALLSSAMYSCLNRSLSPFTLLTPSSPLHHNLFSFLLSAGPPPPKKCAPFDPTVEFDSLFFLPVPGELQTNIISCSSYWSSVDPGLL